MIITIPTNDRETIAVHTGRCREFAFYEIEEGKIISEAFKENLHAENHGDSCCGRHENNGQKHSHAEILKLLEDTDLLFYYAMGKGLRDELSDNLIPFEKAKHVNIDEILKDFIQAKP